MFFCYRPGASGTAALIKNVRSTASMADEALRPAIDAPLPAWRAHVRRVFDALEEARSLNDIAHWNHALEQAAQDYAQRSCEPVRDIEALRANRELAACFAEHADLDACAHALSRLAQGFARMNARLSEFDGIDAPLLCDLVRSYSRHRPGDALARKAIRELADEVCHRLNDNARYFDDEQKQGLLAWFGLHREEAADAIQCLRHTEQPRMRARPAAPRQLVMSDAESAKHHAGARPDGNVQMASRAKSLSKQAKARESQNEIQALIGQLLEQAGEDDSLGRYAWRELTDLANAFAKFADEGKTGSKGRASALESLVTDGLVAIAVALVRRERTLDRASAIDLSLLVNGLSKRAGKTGEVSCNQALRLLAEAVAQRNSQDFKSVELSNLVNGFSKLAGDASEAACNEALRLLAEEVAQRNSKDFSAVHLSNLANGFSKLTSDPSCRDGIAAIAAHLAAIDDVALKALLIALTQRGPLCNALGLCAQADRDAEAEQSGHAAVACAAALSRIALVLLTMSPDAAVHGLLDFALMLRGLQRAELGTTMRSLAQHCCARLLALTTKEHLSGEDLETLGTLCMALMPLARSRAAPALRRQALALLAHSVLPAAWRKLELHAAGASPAAPRSSSASSASSENCATRCPEYSYYAIARAGAETARFWTRRNTEGEHRRHLAATRQRLIAQSRQVWERLGAINNGDISGYSWNLIAQLEAESPSTILDDFVRTHWDSIRNQPPAARFDWNRVFAELTGEPRLPPHGKGIVTVPRSDFAGKTPAVAEAQPRYSILARLSEGSLPLLQVDLPSALTSFLLGRAVHYKGVAYRVDVTGGSGMKPARKTVEQAFAAAQGGEHAPPHDAAGRLYAPRVTDTGPGTSFSRLMEALFPYTEAYYYFQRALMSSPPKVAAAHGPAAHVLEGCFRIGVLPDRAAGQHPFQLRDAQGNPLALQPHDGMGFLRESVAQRYPWYAELTGANAEPFGGTTRQANLPPDALQHYARDEQVAAEVAGRLPTQGDVVQRFRALTQGARGKGHIAKAVPACGAEVVLPASKPAGEALLLGRAPYETAKLQPVPNEQVRRGDDATARFLDASPWLQYSFVCRRPDGALSFFKGGLMVVPDAQWPAAYADRHLVFSAEDEKSRSGWRETKARHREEARFDAEAMLAITEAFGPGSCVAVPLALQKAMGGDYDGDDVLLVSGMPALHEAVRRHQATHAAPELKLPKTHTSAYRDGEYYLGRAGQIAATRLNVLGRYTLLQRRLLMLPEEAQQRLAETVLSTLCREGLNKTLEAGLEALLDTPDGSDAQALLSELDRRAMRSHGEVMRRCFAGIAADVRALLAGQACTDDDALRALLPAPPNMPLPELPTDPQDRLALWLEHMPWSGPELPEAVWQAHLRGAPRAGLESLLMLGIKAGEDAYKSDTGVRLYDRIGRKLERLFSEQKVEGTVPYSRQTMHLMLRDGFDAEAAHAQSELLAQAPNLAAAVMQDTLGQWLRTCGEAPQPAVGAAATSTADSRPNVNAAPQRTDRAPASRKRPSDILPERNVRPRIDRQAAPVTPPPRPAHTRRREREEDMDERRVRHHADADARSRDALPAVTMGRKR